MDNQTRKHKLEEEKAQLEEKLKKMELVTDFDEGEGRAVDSFDTEADEAEEFAKNAGQRQELKNRIAEINEELAKLEENE